MDTPTLNEMRAPQMGGVPPQDPERLEKAHALAGKRSILMVALLVAILVVIALVAASLKQPDVRYDDAGNRITDAREGELAEGFPVELIRESGVTIEGSYAIDYTDGSSPFARYTSAETFEQNIDGFRRLFVERGWLITKDGSTYEAPVTNFVASKDGANVNVTLSMNEDGAIVVEIIYFAPAA